MNNISSLQNTLQDLKEIVQRNQGVNHESAMVVRQLELIVADIERKTRKQTIPVVVPQTVQAIPLT